MRAVLICKTYEDGAAFMRSAGHVPADLFMVPLSGPSKARGRLADVLFATPAAAKDPRFALALEAVVPCVVSSPWSAAASAVYHG